MSAGYEVDGPDVRETRCPGGPLLVHGAAEVRGPDGELWPVERPVVALCRCRRSDRQPWCDGSHKVPPDPSPGKGEGRAGAASVRR